MNLLRHLFASGAAVSQELSEEERLLQENLRKFFASYRTKQEVLDRLTDGGSIYPYLDRLRYALADEISAIENGEQAEHEIITDLKYMSKDAYISRIEELEQVLAAARERDKYTARLLEDLREVLLAEAQKVRRLYGGDHDPAIVESLTNLLMIEKELVEKLAVVEDLQGLFADLAIGERREEEIKGAEKRLATRLYAQMNNVALTEGGVESLDDHYISRLTAHIFNKLETVIMDAARSGLIEKHTYMDLEFVNSELFDQFVWQEIAADRSLGKAVPSERTVQLFIRIFREMYNAQVMPS